MKNILKITMIFLLVLSMVGCTKTSNETVKIATMTGITSNEVLEVAKEALEDKGYNVEIVLFTDNITPNTALEEGSVDFNFFQHIPFLNAYNKENGTNFVKVGDPLYGGVLGIHSDKFDSLDEIEDGATVGIANDSSNRTLHLQFLDELGLIKIKDGLEIVTLDDIVENPKNLEFIEMEDTYIIRSLPDVDFGMCSQNGIVKAGLDPDKAIVTKNLMDGAVLVTNEKNKDSEVAKDVYDALRSDKVKEYLEENYKDVLELLF